MGRRCVGAKVARVLAAPGAAGRVTVAYRQRHQGTTDQRGLGWKHVKDLRRLKAQHRDGDLCWRCGRPMYKWQALDRDHITPRALGGADGPAVLAHASCNRSAGARMGNRMRGMMRAGWSSSRQW